MFFQPDFRSLDASPDREFHHWHPGSEQIAVVSQLYSALLNGWNISSYVFRKDITFRGSRRTAIYYFELQRQGHYMTMPVQENPALIRFLSAEPFTLADYSVVRPSVTYPLMANA